VTTRPQAQTQPAFSGTPGWEDWQAVDRVSREAAANLRSQTAAVLAKHHQGPSRSWGTLRKPTLHTQIAVGHLERRARGVRILRQGL
jgi:hypothetical protein